jgi:hypothetical protein
MLNPGLRRDRPISASQKLKLETLKQVQGDNFFVQQHTIDKDQFI